jgi:hypothetical protein
VSVEPQYSLAVDADEARLTARLSYNVRGAKAARLEIDMGDWRLDRIEPPELAPDDADRPGEEGMLVVPLSNRTRGAPIVVTIHARRNIPASSSRVDWQLPRPIADSVAPASLRVQPADNVSLSNLDSAANGLTRRTPPTDAPGGGDFVQRPTYYRAAPDAPVRYQADFRVEPRRILVRSGGRIEFGERQVRVVQSFDVQISHVAAEQIAFRATERIAANSDLQFRVDGEPVAATRLDLEAIGSDPSHAPRVRLAVPLPRETIGRVRIEASFLTTVDSAAKENATGNTTLDLIVPDDVEWAENRLQIESDGSLRVQLADAAWKLIDSTPVESGGRRIELKADNSIDRLTLSIAPTARRTIVELAWIQSYLVSAARHDRVVYRFRTNDEEVRLRLPSGVAPERAAYWLDGRPTAVRGDADDASIVAVELSRESAGATHVFEIAYSVANSSSGGRERAVDAPVWLDEAQTLKTVWQLALPEREYVLSDPAGMTPEFTWGWRPLVRSGDRSFGFQWGRQPSLDERRLARESGAVQDMSLPERTNQYVYTTLGAPDRLSVAAAGRSLILLVASGAALAIGLTIMYLPSPRRGAAWLALAVLLVGGAALYPALTVLVAQAASFGLALTFISGAIRRVVDRRQGRSAKWHGSTVTAAANSSSSVVIPPGSSLVTTLSGPMEADSPGGESKP